MASLLTLLLAGAASGSLTAPSPKVVEFPGSVTSAPSPDGRLRVFYREHIDPSGANASPIFVGDGRRRAVQIGTISRNVGIGWARHEHRLFLQNNWGSNIADCDVIAVSVDRRVTGVSLSTIVNRTPGHLRATRAHPGRTTMSIAIVGDLTVSSKDR